ncbi:VOC family protein [Catellatospora tritici]|uniref:VOC family protein n=1 Tax=Catellatospora tritici TaxID=2851566 RepID=UPI001C2DBC2B|nr:VOC family protein [Catellatospora tritici]MBV1850905.1 glyoxalase/bleomycin resistance/dioxygenase family protein [Catellatospora tritici]MBV1851158.1 glyoxalase/bleomycin resistance/dioxygenase family protein [Catellatospora tritici]
MPYISSVVIHCRDPYVMAPFWSLVTGLPIVDEDAAKLADRSLAERESVLLHDPSGTEPDVWIAPALDLLPVGRIHLDIVADDDERAEIVAAGATLVREQEDLTVFTDPEGNEFCLLRERH